MALACLRGAHLLSKSVTDNGKQLSQPQMPALCALVTQPSVQPFLLLISPSESFSCSFSLQCPGFPPLLVNPFSAPGLTSTVSRTVLELAWASLMMGSQKVQMRALPFIALITEFISYLIAKPLDLGLAPPRSNNGKAGRRVVFFFFNPHQVTFLCQAWSDHSLNTC